MTDRVDSGICLQTSFDRSVIYFFLWIGVYLLPSSPKKMQSGQSLPKYHCNRCLRTFTYKTSFRKQKCKESSQSLPQYHCERCLKTFIYKTSFGKQKCNKASHSLQDFHCEQCLRTFAYEKNFHKHKCSTYHCNECQKKILP